jgi:sugar lactone lactonase YvrE
MANRSAASSASHFFKVRFYFIEKAFLLAIRDFLLVLVFLCSLVAPLQAQNTYNINRFAGTTTPGFSGDGGAATSAQLDTPTGIALDASGNVYFADTMNNRIRKIDSNGIIATVAGNGVWGFSGDGGMATAAQLNYPRGIAVDAAGNLYVSDTQNHRIRRVNSSGIITSLAGNGTAGYGGDGGPAATALINTPGGIAVDSSGNIYFADTNNHRIRRIAPNGTITTLAGTGAKGFSGDGSAATGALLNTPAGVAVDSRGQVYIADTANNRIRQVNSNGIISTIAGNGNMGFGFDGGAATRAPLFNPAGLALDSSGNIFFTDKYNYRVRMVTAAGSIYSIAGTGQSGYAGDGGAALAADLQNLEGIAVDAKGRVYVPVYHNVYNSVAYGQSAIRLLNATAQTCTYSIGTLNPSPPSFRVDGGPGTVQVNTGGNCSWTAASSDSTWLTLSTTSFMGNGTLFYSVAPTTCPTRYGVITISATNFKQYIYINQYGTLLNVVLSSLSPNQTPAGGPSFALTVTGSGFTAGMEVLWNGSSRPTTVLSSTQLTAQISAADIATPGTASVAVRLYYPACFSEIRSNSMTFLITGPPIITSITPASVAACSPDFTMIVNGTNFLPSFPGFLEGSTVRWNGSSRTTTYVSPTQLNVFISASDLTAAGTASITVLNPNQQVSNAFPFSVLAPAINALSPTSASEGGPAFQLTVNGNNFGPGMVVQWNGSDRPTSFVNSSQLSVAIPASDIARAGTASIAVINRNCVNSNTTFFSIYPQAAIEVINITTTVPPAEQPIARVTLSSPSPCAVSGQLSLSFTDNSDASLNNNPEIVFIKDSNSSSTINFTVAQGAQSAQFSGLPAGTPGDQAIFQSGTVAGSIRLITSMTCGGAPFPELQRDLTVPRTVPVISSLTVSLTTGGFDLVILGYSSSRSLQTANFSFAPRPGSSLSNAVHSLNINNPAATWYADSQSFPFGSKFKMTVPFTYSGDISAIGSVTVNIGNVIGSSDSKSANFP